MRKFSHTDQSGRSLPIILDFVFNGAVIAQNTSAVSIPNKGDKEFICGKYYLVDEVIGYNEECKYEISLTQPESK